MATAIDLAKILAELAWPLAFIFFVWWFYQPVKELLRALREQIIQGASVKYGELELKGIPLSDFPLADPSVYTIAPADDGLFTKRHENYSESKNIFLVHRVKKSGQRLEPTGLQIFDVSVYLLGHKHFGALNDVKWVEYYFGKFFKERTDHEYGSKYIVRNSKNGFAVRTTAYGPTLCEARVEFHDGSTALMSRYIDFEGTDYKYDFKLVGKADSAKK